MTPSWSSFSFRIPPDMKAMVERMASAGKVSQSEIIRRAVNEYVANHSTDEWERRAAEIALRKEERKLKLAAPIDGYDAGMQVVTAWDTIQKQKGEYEQMGILRRSLYEHWIHRLEENAESIGEDNPDRELILESFELLVEKLEREADSLFPGGEG